MPNNVEPSEKRKKRREAGQQAAVAAQASGAGDDAASTDKKKSRRERAAAANKITFILETEVRKFIAAEARSAGMDIAPFLQKLVENHIVSSAPSDAPLVQRLQAKRAVLDYAVALAGQIDRNGEFDEHFILTVMKRAASNPDFQAQYEIATAAPVGNERAAARAKAPINQQLGRLIKRAAGAKGKRGKNGKILRGQVQGEILTTYTLLEKAA